MGNDELDLSSALLQAQAIVDFETSIDYAYLVICSAFVLLMELGFAFLEGGCVRYRNMQSIMLKVWLNTSIAVVMWWLVGYGIAFGKASNGFIGTSQFAGTEFQHSHHYSHYAFQVAVGAAANSIVSGGAAERMTFQGYVWLSVIFSSLIYPFCAHWGFGEGWLMEMGYHDFAGSGTVHASAGIGALMTTLMLKPRNERFNPKYAEHFEPNNPTYITLATLSLWTCWCFFNGGSSLGVSHGQAVILSRAMMNTFIAGSSGALTVFFLNYFINITSGSRYSLVMMCNGNLAGLVAITGACDNVEPWAAFTIGIMAGFTYISVNRLLFRLQIDDPVDAIPIHFGCGMLGANVVSWFDIDHGILYCGGGKQFGIQLLGSFVFIAYSAILHLIALSFIASCNMLRVSPEEEAMGLDPYHIAQQAYTYHALPYQVTQTETTKTLDTQHR